MSVFDYFPVLETPRLILRRITEADAADLFAVFSDDAVTEHYDLYTFEELDEAYDLVEYFDESYQHERQIRWGIERREDGRLLGTCGFVALYEHRGEIGYELGRAYWRQGYMREALAALLAYGFMEMELNRIEDAAMAALLEHDGVARYRPWLEEVRAFRPHQLSDDLEKLAYVRDLSRRANRIIWENIAFALGVIVVLVTANFLVGVPLPLGVVAHEGSTLLVVFNGLRLLR